MKSLRHFVLLFFALVLLGASVPFLGPSYAQAPPLPPVSINFGVPPRVPPPSFGATDFEVFIPGDWRNNVITGRYNSFSSPATDNSSFDGNNTIVTFSGGTIPHATPYGCCSLVPHFGLRGVPQVVTPTGGEKIDPPVPWEWTFLSGVPEPVPTLGVTFTSGTTGPTRYAIFTITYEVPDGDPGDGTDNDETTGFFELPFQGSITTTFDASAGTMELSGAGYMFSNTEIPLENLNGTDLPSSFSPITFIPDGTVLLNGTSTQPITVPEPGSLVLLAVGLAGLSLGRRRD